jgi:predicted amidohydrolase YtcJ
MCLAVDDFEEEVELIRREGRGDERLHWTHLKVFADGALNPRTAWMLAPYADDPDNRGISVTPPEELRRWSERAAAVGFALAVHAIGDAANHAVLDAFEATRDLWKPRGLRPRIEHAQTLAPDDVPRFARLGVVASMQPIHCTQDLVVADRALGPRASRAYVFRSLAETGATLAFGSDCPVETLDVLQGLYAAVARRRADGYPPGGWYPRQRLSIEEAVGAYTRGAAWAEGEEARRGALEPGKLADLVILSRGIFDGPPEVLLDTRVDGTIVGGEWVYRGF